jgi:microcompartment protein CcmK/EutM
MEGQKLLLVQPLAADRETPDGDPQLVIDHFGADRGSIVVLTSDGRYTRELLDCDKTPVRWCVIGIAD